jgi:hypothetical protein
VVIVDVPAVREPLAEVQVGACAGQPRRDGHVSRIARRAHSEPHVRRGAATAASGRVVVGRDHRVAGIPWLECYDRGRGGVVPGAEHGRLQVAQASGLSRGCQPGHGGPVAQAARGAAVVGESEVAAGLARQSSAVDDADFQLRGDTGVDAGGRGRTRRSGRRRTRRALAAARGHHQSARRCGQGADGGRAATSRRSGEPAMNRRSCPRITDCLKPHCVSLRCPSATAMARAGQLVPGAWVSRSDACTASRAPGTA